MILRFTLDDILSEDKLSLMKTSPRNIDLEFGDYRTSQVVLDFVGGFCSPAPLNAPMLSYLKDYVEEHLGEEIYVRAFSNHKPQREVDEVQMLTDTVKRQKDDGKTVLTMGHSKGGVIVIKSDSKLQGEVDGSIVYAPKTHLRRGFLMQALPAVGEILTEEALRGVFARKECLELAGAYLFSNILETVYQIEELLENTYKNGMHLSSPTSYIFAQRDHFFKEYERIISILERKVKHSGNVSFDSIPNANHIDFMYRERPIRAVGDKILNFLGFSEIEKVA